MRAQRFILVVIVTLISMAGPAKSVSQAQDPPKPAPLPRSVPILEARQKATFAGGCFWCTEADFDKVRGVISTTSGYTGGRVANPSYAQVSSGGTGHTEAVEVVFDPTIVTYEQLLDHFWRNVDPFVANRQFCDVGDQYRPEIFVHNAAQRAAAEASMKQMQRRFRQPIVVRISDAGPFYRAEEYHQNYHNTHAVRYKYYRWRCGRDARLAAIWGDE